MSENNSATEDVKSQSSGSTSGERADVCEKQSTSRQLVMIVFIMAFATKMFLLPIFLIQTIGRDAYIALAIGGGIDLSALAVFIVCMVKAQTDFFTILSAVLGKVGAKITVGIIGLFLFFKLNIGISETLRFYSGSVFGDFNVLFMLVPLLIFFCAVANHTLRALCRLNEIILPLIVVCIAILITVVALTGFDLANIFPSMQYPDVFKTEAVHHAAWLGDFTPLVLFVGRTKTKKHTALFAGISGTVGTGIAVFFALVMSAAFGNVRVLVDSSTNLSSILQYSLGNVYGRVDLFSSVIWSISTFIESALLYYAACRCFAFVIGKNAHFWIALIAALATYLIQVCAMTDPTVFSVIVTSIVTSVATLTLTVATPALALVCTLVHRMRCEKDVSGGDSKQSGDCIGDATRRVNGENRI